MIKTNCPRKTSINLHLCLRNVTARKNLRIQLFLTLGGDAPEGQCSYTASDEQKRCFLSRGEAAAPQGHSERTYKIWLGSEGFRKVSPWRVPESQLSKECKSKARTICRFTPVSSPKLLSLNVTSRALRLTKVPRWLSGKKKREISLGKIHRNIFWDYTVS